LISHAAGIVLLSLPFLLRHDSTGSTRNSSQNYADNYYYSNPITGKRVFELSKTLESKKETGVQYPVVELLVELSIISLQNSLLFEYSNQKETPCVLRTL